MAIVVQTIILLSIISHYAFSSDCTNSKLQNIRKCLVPKLDYPWNETERNESIVHTYHGIEVIIISI